MTTLPEPMRAETPQERKLLRLFRAMTPAQQKAAIALLEAMVAFQDAMKGGK